MSKYTFSKADRLRKRSEYLHTLNTGKRFHSKHFVAIIAPSAANRTRLGVTVSKRVGNAVTRNRIKRLSREFFRLNQHTLKGTWDINLIAKDSAATTDNHKILESLEKIWCSISGSIDR